MQDNDATRHTRASYLQAAGQRLRARFGPQVQPTVLFLAFWVLLLSSLAPLAMEGLGVARPIPPWASPGKPNLFDPRSQATSASQANPVDPHIPPVRGPSGPPSTLSHPNFITMQPGVLALSPDQAAQFTGSDGLLQIDVP